MSLETTSKRDAILEHLQADGRSRYEYWLAGNDIDRENVWVWSGTNGDVPSFGWIDPPVSSFQDNCLSWSISISHRNSRMNEGWHSDSCCNNIRFICEL